MYVYHAFCYIVTVNTFASFPTRMILISFRDDFGNTETESQLYINIE